MQAGAALDGFCHVSVRDPDGNAIAFAEPPVQSELGETVAR